MGQLQTINVKTGKTNFQKSTSAQLIYRPQISHISILARPSLGLFFEFDDHLAFRHVLAQFRAHSLDDTITRCLEDVLHFHRDDDRNGRIRLDAITNTD